MICAFDFLRRNVGTDFLEETKKKFKVMTTYGTIKSMMFFLTGKVTSCVSGKKNRTIVFNRIFWEM